MAGPKSTKLCECGCGQFTNIATRSRISRGIVKGQPARFIEHHAAVATRAAVRTHGLSNSPTHRSWLGMVQRCTYPKHQAWANYGGRGIKVCDKWLKLEGFVEDMGVRPAGMTLDRIDVNGNYEHGNCRWISRFDQHGNYRNNVKLTFNGKTQHIAAWERETGLGKKTIRDRLLRGWSVEETLTMPPVPPKERSKRRGRDPVTGRIVRLEVESEPPVSD